MPDDGTVLSGYYDDDLDRYVEITISDYNEMLNNKDEVEKKKILADFIYNRLHARYIRPYTFNDDEYRKKYKNGFSMMASFCLLIETLQSFKKGWGDTRGKSKEAFRDFFTNNACFPEFNPELGEKIYVNIRCGIMHQGETKGGWKITRKGNELYNHETNTLNAIIFGKRMEDSLNQYRKDLMDSDWDLDNWKNFRKKMVSIIKNCKRNNNF
jgi:hypothetical protein